MDRLRWLRRGATLIVAACMFLLLCAAPAGAGTQSQARVALHVTARTVKYQCTSGSPNGEGLPCSRYVTGGLVARAYHVYLVVGHADPTAGLSGMSCRIEYDTAERQGVDVFGWTLCADQEMPKSSAHGAWPAPMSTNTITWNAETNCQRTEIGGEGVHAVAGAFYIYTYGAGDLSIAPTDSGLTVEDCQGSITHLGQPFPRVAFRETLGYTGVNPCESPCRGLTPSAINLGAVPVGETRDSTVTIRNDGTSVIRVPWSVSGAAFTLFASVDPFLLQPGWSTAVTVRFAPSTFGAAQGYLSTGSPCWSSILLSATGLEACAFTPTTLGFGGVVVGQAETLSVTLTNIHDATLAGTLEKHGDDFMLGLADDAFVLATGDSMRVPIVFRPLQEGAHKGTLSAGSACPGVALSGTGLLPCAVVPASHDFGVVPVGAYRDAAFALINNQHVALSGQVVVQGASFSVAYGAGPFLLPPGGVHHFSLRFTPTAVGSRLGGASFGSPCEALPLTGQGRAPVQRCLVQPGPEVAFGLVQVGTESSGLVRYVNAGEAPFSLKLSDGSMLPSFSLPLGTGPFAVPVGDTLAVPVRFVPLGSGVHVGTLVADSPCDNVRLRGLAQRSPLACIADASSLDFGEVPIDSSREIGFHLFNYAIQPALGQIVALCDDFSVVGENTYQIAWADSHKVHVRFTPRTPGTQSCGIAVLGGCADTLIAVGRGMAVPDTVAADTSAAGPWFFAASRPDEGVQRLAYEIIAAAHVEITVFDVAGHELVRFDEGVRAPGRFEVSWDARQQPDGIYFVRIEAAPRSAVRKLLLLR